MKKSTNKYNPLNLITNGSPVPSNGGVMAVGGGQGPNRGSLTVDLRLFIGDIKQFHRENQISKASSFPEARKLGFPNVIMPGDVRLGFHSGSFFNRLIIKLDPKF